MRIIRIEAFVVKIARDHPGPASGVRPLTEDYYVLDKPLSVVYSRRNESVLVKITTQEGITGWGEVLAPTSPEVVCAVIETALAPCLMGADAFEHQVLWNRMYNMFRVRGYNGGFLLDGIAGIDIALWDLKGKALGQPVWRLLGGASHERVPVYVSANGGETVPERVDYVRGLVEGGFHAFKLHAVGEGWRDALAVLEGIRKEYGPRELKLMHDGHWNYTLGEARKFGRLMNGLDLEFFECPLPPEDLEGHVELARTLDTPLALGESMRNASTFAQWIDRKAVQFVQPDAGRVGITDYMRIAAVAEAHHLMTGPHLSTHLSVGFMASLHLAIATPSTRFFEYQPVAEENARKFSSRDAGLVDGCLTKPTAPGLGVDISEKALLQYITHKITVEKTV
ncbi:MAG: mandelate racemase/muconate lactonizing enzyme family protein [Candidatus Limiplasma sp.]|nr:mandelate racemase/muconate lactonizing enzyme family protein [Candidatus Limiplasma sp.]